MTGKWKSLCLTDITRTLKNDANLPLRETLGYNPILRQFLDFRRVQNVVCVLLGISPASEV